MKFFIVLCLAALAFGKPSGSSSDSADRIIRMINQYGYPAEAKAVTTDDGYVLQLIRIPGGKNASNLQQQRQQRQQSSDKKTPVLLMHGMMSSAEDWIYGGPTQSLAFQLADTDNDVYLGSARGSRYGMGHTKLHAERDRAFWDFCWDDIGTQDMPALIDAALQWNGQSKLNVVAHMAGTTAFLVMASERSEMNSKVNRMVALGPMAFMKESTMPLMQEILPNLTSKSWLMKNLGMTALKLSSNLASTIQGECVRNAPRMQKQLCENVYFPVNGYNSPQMNMTTVEQEVMPGVPSGCSAREIIHFAQLVRSGRFQKYVPLNQNDNDADQYDLSKVIVQMNILYAPKDELSPTEGVQRLINKLPNVKRVQMVNTITNNLDLLWSKSSNEINNEVMNMLTNSPSNDAVQQSNKNSESNNNSNSNSNESGNVSV